MQWGVWMSQKHLGGRLESASGAYLPSPPHPLLLSAWSDSLIRWPGVWRSDGSGGGKAHPVILLQLTTAAHLVPTMGQVGCRKQNSASPQTQYLWNLLAPKYISTSSTSHSFHGCNPGLAPPLLIWTSTVPSTLAPQLPPWSPTGCLPKAARGYL